MQLDGGPSLNEVERAVALAFLAISAICFLQLEMPELAVLAIALAAALLRTPVKQAALCLQAALKG